MPDTPNRVPALLRPRLVRRPTSRPCSQAIGRLGYDGVEFAGLHGHDAGVVRGWIDAAGLTACAVHTSVAKLEADTQAVVDEAKALGTDRVILAHVPTPDLGGRGRRGRGLIAQARQRGRERRRGFAFHNHAAELVDFDGASTIDRLAAASPSLGLEIDLGWAWIADVDPLALLALAPGPRAARPREGLHRARLRHVLPDRRRRDGLGRAASRQPRRPQASSGSSWSRTRPRVTSSTKPPGRSPGSDGCWARQLVNEAARHLALLTRTIEVVNSSLDLQEVMEAIAHEVAAALGTDACFVYLYDERTDELVLRATHGTRVEDATIAPRMRAARASPASQRPTARR